MTLDDLPSVRAVPTVTAAQMAEIDRVTAEELHIPVEVLMENAGRRRAGARGSSSLGPRGIVTFRALGAARSEDPHAPSRVENMRGIVAQVAAPQARLRNTTRDQIGRLLLASRSDVAVVHDAAWNGLRDLDADLLIDGLLGYSAEGAPRETIAKLIDAANASNVPILAVDLPSGTEPDTGATPGVAIHATATVTLTLPKSGVVEGTARDHVGDLLLADIAIPHAAFARIGVDTWRLFEEGDLVQVEAHTYR